MQQHAGSRGVREPRCRTHWLGLRPAFAGSQSQMPQAWTLVGPSAGARRPPKLWTTVIALALGGIPQRSGSPQQLLTQPFGEWTHRAN